ncbi:SDR family NAD(P)-dependent oxidoreductase [Acidisoma sp.]|uniref:SDR family NAD(P)-dependent oxidoreductase n=1 Tax=Acidisoma sp. TaxID=1872115 RepID=UPI003B00AE6C
MATLPYRTALIIGAGPGISASVARHLATEGLKVALAARDTAKLADIVHETGAVAFAADATDPAAVAALFLSVDERLGEPDVVIYNASMRVPGPLAELDPEAVRQSLQVSAFGGFLAVQQAAQRMVPKGLAPSCSRAPRPASKAMRAPPPSPWASSRCAAWHRAPHGSWGRRASMSRISTSMAACEVPGGRTPLTSPTAR